MRSCSPDKNLFLAGNVARSATQKVGIMLCIMLPGRQVVRATSDGASRYTYFFSKRLNCTSWAKVKSVLQLMVLV